MPTLNHRTRLAALAAVPLLLTACSAGSSSQSDEAAPAGPESRTVETVLGEVTVPGQVDSVVVLEGRGDQDMVLSLGLPLRGMPEIPASEGFDLEHPLAEETQKAKDAGAKELFLDGEINLEAIAAAGPDLIVSRIDDIEPIQAELQAIAPVIAIGAQTGVSWREDLRLIGRATGTEARAEELISDYEARVAEVKEKYATQIAETTVAPIGYDDEGTDVLADRMQSRVLTDVGAKPAKAFADALAASSGEVAFSPELTLRAYQDANAMFIAADRAAEWEAAQADPLVQELPAMKNGRVIRTDKFSFEGGPIVLNHVLDLVEELYATS